MSDDIDKDVTLLITACNRPDLLKKTLDSFVKYNTYPIKEAIIIEDSGVNGINDESIKELPFPCKMIYNESRIGQMKSIEKAAAHITTGYTFHCEEDWEFYDYGFIEKSFEIIDKDSKVVTVMLRGYDENRINSGITIDFTDRGNYYYTNYSLHITDTSKGAAGILSWNPSLRKTIDEKAYMPYESYLCEGGLGYLFYLDGRRAAVTNNPNGYVRHIGWNRHVW